VLTTFGEISRTITFDTIPVVGNAPPAAARNWWPWIVAALVVGGLVLMTREQRHRPLGGGG
jgi:hypothetical protein